MDLEIRWTHMEHERLAKAWALWRAVGGLPTREFWRAVSGLRVYCALVAHSVDRRRKASHADRTSMSSRELSTETPVKVGDRRFGFGVSLGTLLTVMGFVIAGALAFNSLQNSVQNIAVNQQEAKQVTAQAISDLGNSFNQSLSEAAKKAQEQRESDKQLQEAERKRLELVQTNTNERLASISGVVDTIRPLATVVPVLDQRVAAVERAANEFREVAAESKATRQLLIEMRAEIREYRSELKTAKQ